MWNMMSDNRRLPLFSSLAIRNGVQLLGTVLSDVDVNFELSFGQAGKQLLSSSMALKRFRKDLAVAEAVGATSTARCGAILGE
jgi:hypothetical protein